MVTEESLTETECYFGQHWSTAGESARPIHSPRSGCSQQQDVPFSRKDVSMTELDVCLTVSPPSSLLNVLVGFSHTRWGSGKLTDPF